MFREIEDIVETLKNAKERYHLNKLGDEQEIIGYSRNKDKRVN